MIDGVGRTQIAVYAAIGIVLLLLGIRAFRESAPPGAGSAEGGGTVQISQAPVGSGGPADALS
nr:hypothetical protein [Solirubrobacterales bacterium]